MHNQKVPHLNQPQTAIQRPVSQPGPQSLPAYQSLPEFTNICPTCQIPLQGLRCQCGFVNLGMVTTTDVRTVREPKPVPVTYARETEYVTCKQCGQSLTPKGETHCYSCGLSLNSEGGISSVWRCPSCSYGYNREASCLKCHVPKPGVIVPKPSPPVVAPVQLTVSGGSTLVWNCPCGYEYNLQTASVCLKCQLPKGGEAPPGWQCQCGSYNPVNQSQCTHCYRQNPNLRPPQPKPVVPSVEGDGSWLCQRCKKSNHKTSISCHHCKTPKVQLASPPAVPRRPRGY